MTNPNFTTMSREDRISYHLKWLIATVDFNNDQSGCEAPPSEDMIDAKKLLEELGHSVESRFIANPNNTAPTGLLPPEPLDDKTVRWGFGL
jgi:hypothetical protein